MIKDREQKKKRTDKNDKANLLDTKVDIFEIIFVYKILPPSTDVNTA